MISRSIDPRPAKCLFESVSQVTAVRHIHKRAQQDTAPMSQDRYINNVSATKHSYTSFTGNVQILELIGSSLLISFKTSGSPLVIL